MSATPTERLNAALSGRYTIERKLGEGGMAIVYLKHSRQVALKVLKPELAAVVGAERFLAEITTTANLPTSCRSSTRARRTDSSSMSCLM
jgi:serine/threonine-protein kinase